MEFLMTYGWAILVVLAAIGALAYFGVLSPDRFLPSKCQVSPPFSCTEFSVTDGSDGVQLGITNNAGVDMAEVNVTVEDDTGDCGTNVTGVTSNGDQVGGGLIAWPSDGQGSVANACTGLNTDDRFDADITIRYRQAGESVYHTSTGTVTARVEQS